MNGTFFKHRYAVIISKLYKYLCYWFSCEYRNCFVLCSRSSEALSGFYNFRKGSKIKNGGNTVFHVKQWKRKYKNVRNDEIVVVFFRRKWNLVIDLLLLHWNFRHIKGFTGGCFERQINLGAGLVFMSGSVSADLCRIFNGLLVQYLYMARLSTQLRNGSVSHIIQYHMSFLLRIPNSELAQ